jgi:PBSX family phage terminase large subunit
MREYLPIGDKAKMTIRETGFLTVYEGSVRSMKTVTSLIKWYNYVINSVENVFLMSGNTLGSISRNCINGDFGLIAISSGKAQPRTDTDGSKYLLIGKKIVYYCGADNEASYKKIRGLSIGGWYADEINLQAKSFIETAFARSFASRDRQNIWTLNPEAPTHWIYADYIDKYQAEKTPGYHWHHFTLDDNPSLTEERKKEIAAQFTGVFYKRYVLGLRVRAEGGIYTSFVNNKPGEPGNVLDELPGLQRGHERERVFKLTLGADFGGSKSATAFNATGWFINPKGQLSIVTVLEYYDCLNKSVESVLSAWKTFVLKAREIAPIERAFGDSSEQLIIKSMNSCGTGVYVENAWKRPIIDRIRLYDVLYSQGRAFVLRSCPKTVEAFENAVWDAKKTDERLDDGTTNIDSLDAAEYAVERDASQLLESMRSVA